jgi:hypothetical protein
MMYEEIGFLSAPAVPEDRTRGDLEGDSVLLHTSVKITLFWTVPIDP